MLQANKGEQVAHLGLNRQDIEQYLLNKGLWTCAPKYGKENTHYVLSPCAYQLSQAQQSDLNILARRTYAALRSINERLVSYAALGPQLNNIDAAFLKLARSAVQGLASPESGILELPPVIKVDLMRRFDGQFQIAEVDAYNPRGFGYLALLDGTLPDTASVFPGMKQVKSLLRTAGGEDQPEWNIVVSEFERYYEPSMRILATSLQDHGVQAKIVRESTLTSNHELLNSLTHVLVIPDSLQSIQVKKRLMERYLQGELALFFPPLAYLGTKSFLPTIMAEKKMVRHVPACGLVSHQHDPLPRLKGDLILKGVVSSGMKQIVFSDLEPDQFLRTLRSARACKSPSWIMQEQVKQAPLPVVVFNDDGSEEERKYFFRLTAYITEEGLLGAEVTGRPDKMVHGAPDCIMIPCVLG